MKKIIFLRTMLAATVMLLAGMNLRGDNVVYTFSVLGSNNISNPSGDINSSVSFTTQKNQSSTDPAYNGTAGEIRLYYHSGGDGGSITLTPKNGAVITEVKITATTTPVVKYNVDGGADATANLSGTTYTISGISVSSGLKIRNANTSNNTQFRFTSIEITYTASSCNDADLQFGVSSVRKLDTDAGFTETATSVAGSTGTVTYESTNTGVATVNANTGEVTITGAGTTQIKAAIAAAGSFCADEASYDLKVYPGANAKTYELVTSDAGLADDAKYLIVGIKGAEYYALGWQKASNRHAIEIPVVNDEVTIGVAATVSATQDEVYPYEITLKSHASEFMLYDALNAGYLRPNTGGSTGLYTKPQEAYWTINFGTGANLECTGSEDGANFESYVFMRFNATNNPPLFNCYGNATGQTDVYLYRETAATPPTDTDPPVLTFDPANNATDVAVTAAITITSNEPLRKADGSELTDGDLTPALVVLKETNSGGTDVPFTATIDAEKKVITVTPSSSLSNSQVYYVAINSVADTAGNLTTLQSVTFTTEAGTPPTTDKYVKITSLTDLTDGYYVVMGNHTSNKAMKNVVLGSSNKYLDTADVVIANDTIINPPASIIWEIKENAGKYTVSNGANYLICPKNDNAADLITVLTDSARWTVAYESNAFVITNVKFANRILKYNNSSPRFACYTAGQNNLLLYKFVTGNTVTDTDPPILTFDPADNATDVAVTAAITITSDEPLRKADGSELTNGDLTPALVVLKETNSGGTDVPFTATIDAEKKVITVTPSSSLSNSQVYYVAINSVADTAGNLTTLQSVTFTTEAGTPQPAGTVLAGWTFPAEDPSSATADLGIAGNIGVKTISRESGFSGNYTYPVGYAPTNEYITGTTATRSISTEDWNLDDESWIISFTTTGYEEIKFYSDIRSSNTGPKNFRIDYSFDGSSWTPTGNTVALSGTAMSQLNGDLPAACDNQATVYLRWINPDNVSANGGTVAAAGANRIDNIVIAGTLLSGSVDTDAPVLTFNPADGATNVAVNTAITITADEPLRKADGSELTDGDLTPALVVLKETDAGGTDVAFTATIDAAKKVITVTPSSSLSNSQVYYAALNPVADTASNLTTLQSVTFTTEAPLSSEADLIDYTIANQISDDINHADKTVNIVMPAGTDITSLTAAFTVSQGAAVTVTGTPQVSGTTANDFTNPVVYKIVSQDGTVTSYWTVTVTVELNSEADIIAFTIPGQAGGTIIDADEATVIVTMPYGTDVTGLVPAITVSDYASISPLSGAAQDFTGIVAYTVTAQDGTVKAWNVSVVFTAPPPSNDNFIISFTLPGQTETTIIDSDARTVTVPMPVGISLADLIPLIHISSGATISPSANTIRDFSNPVIYTVTSESGISALWVVKVQQGSADDGLLFSFINGTQIFHIENRTLGIGKIDIYSNDGRLMYSGKRGSNSEFNNTEFNIDMSGYAGGMYIIRIFNKNHAFTKTIKIIK